MNKKKLIIVGMSGGVDSAVTASLLLEQGFEVEGLHMTNWNDEEPYCTAAQDQQDAREACKELGITMHHVNFSKEYRKEVFDRALEELNSGLTPNPDILCNRMIKFDRFAEYAFRLGGEKIATGHYAKVVKTKHDYELHKGTDTNKDQTYFLHAINPAILSKVIFPVGNMIKSEVRDYAYRKGLPNHNKADSTGICFIGERPFKSFIQNFLPPEPGNIVDEQGEVIGRHDGLMYFTIGQRKDIGIGGLKNNSGEPWYVAAKDIKTNELMVVQGHNHPRLWSKKLFAISLNWLDSKIPTRLLNGKKIHCEAKNRYRQNDARCSIQTSGNGLMIEFKDSQWAVTEGQYVVLYQDEKCLGGGKIMAMPKEDKN